MRYKAIKIMSVAVLGLFLFSSCDDKLDIAKKGNLGSVEDFYKTDEDATKAIGVAYSAWGGLHYGLTFVTNMLSDDCWAGGPSRGDSPDLQLMNEYMFGSDNSTIQSLFSGLYGLNYDCNLVIEKVSPDTPEKKRCLAEAYFFRGWANFYLGALWGTAPKVDHLLQPSEYACGNSEKGDLINFAIENFQQAISLGSLPSKTSVDDAATPIRVTREAAYAYLGKALLFAGRDDEAAKALDEVIDSKLYDLYQGDYGDIHKPVAEFSCESILENNQVDDVNTAWSFMNYVSVMRGWRNDQIAWSGLKAQFADVTSGYGFENPRKALYDAFKAWDEKGGGDDYRLDQTIKTYDYLKNTMGLTVTTTMHGNEGLFDWKLRALKSELVQDMGGWNVLVKTNWRYMRYAEVLLLAAEANLKSNPAKAVEYINKVRTRAHLTPLGSVTLDDVKQEKRFELCFEGIRYMDLVRWGDAATVLKDQGKTVRCFSPEGEVKTEYSNAGAGFQKGKHELLPIPAKELLLNKNINQNDGWAGEEQK